MMTKNRRQGLYYRLKTKQRDKRTKVDKTRHKETRIERGSHTFGAKRAGPVRRLIVRLRASVVHRN
jgi:hypothetical protein